jgi:hypothetical protein
MSMNYLESAISIFPNDSKLLTLAKKAGKIWQSIYKVDFHIIL